MAEEYCGGVNWWDSTTSTNRSRFDGGSGGGGGSSSTSSTTTLANSGGGAGYGWLTEGPTAVDTKLDASSLQLVGLGLSSQAMAEWNQQQTTILNPEKAENSFRSMLQEGMGLTANFQQDTSGGGGGGGVMFGGSNSPQLHQWRPDKLFPSSEDSSTDFKQIGRGFSLDNQPQFSPNGSSIESTVTCQGLTAPSSFQLDNTSSSSSVFGSPSSILQAPLTDVRPNFFSSLQGAQLPTMPTFEEKPKTTMEVRDTSSMAKKNGSENNNKRARNDGASSTLPPFKVRKEKMGDRITALQQLVSPFGKTDTASVLSEAIEYIKFLHEQVSVLSNPYLKSGGSYQQHQPGNEKAKIDPDGPKQDLRSRGLCLVPVSSTFPVTHETTVDFWTPTFGGTFR
uniref:BHLH domain-containing protein n=1 Tax=Chenopodium quinoa TaxID=63459 RepID=A0A803N690_CHEQI